MDYYQRVRERVQKLKDEAHGQGMNYTALVYGNVLDVLDQLENELTCPTCGRRHHG